MGYPCTCEYHGASCLAHLGSRKDKVAKGCLCTVGDPCDYHAASCVVCVGGCKGHPKTDAPWVILRGIQEGNRFFSDNIPGVDPTKLKDGTTAYTVIGYADTVAEAQKMLGF